MYLKTDKIIASVGGVTMRSHAVDGAHYRLDPTAMVGWTDGVDVRRESTPRPVTDGDFTQTATLGTRLVTFTGTAIAPDAVTLHAMQDAFKGILNDGSFDQLSVEDITGVRYATVGLGGKPGWIQITDTAAAFKLDLFAPDPRIYGPEKITQINEIPYYGGADFPVSYPFDFHRPLIQMSEGITNHGNIESWPTFVVTGDFPQGFFIASGNSLIQYNGQVTMQSPVTISSSAGSAVQNNVDRSNMLASRDWFSIKRGETLQPSFGSFVKGPGWCDIIYRDTWI